MDKPTRILRELKADIEAMADTRYEAEGEYYLSGFGESFVDDAGECVISWPNLKYHLDQIDKLLETLEQ